MSGLRDKLNQIIDSHNMISEEIEHLTSEVGADRWDERQNMIDRIEKVFAVCLKTEDVPIG